MGSCGGLLRSEKVRLALMCGAGAARVSAYVVHIVRMAGRLPSALVEIRDGSADPPTLRGHTLNTETPSAATGPAALAYSAEVSSRVTRPPMTRIAMAMPVCPCRMSTVIATPSVSIAAPAQRGQHGGRPCVAEHVADDRQVRDGQYSCGQRRRQGQHRRDGVVLRVHVHVAVRSVSAHRPISAMSRHGRAEFGAVAVADFRRVERHGEADQPRAHQDIANRRRPVLAIVRMRRSLPDARRRRVPPLGRLPHLGRALWTVRPDSIGDRPPSRPLVTASP